MNRIAAAVTVLTVIVAAACTGALAQSAPKTAPKPDLHAGGAKPSSLPNHETTMVTLPGYNLAGTTLTVTGEVCTLKSYKVVSDSQIQMMIEGHRTLDAKEDGCFLHVHQGSFEVGTYVVIDLTEAEWTEKHRKEAAENKAKGEAYMAGLGKQWVIHYADGSSDTYTAQTADEGELPDFTSASGGTAKIATTNGNKVVIMAGGCMRSGTLTGNQVKDGTSTGDCKPAGAWTGQKK
jgi:hypothetical protein